MAASSADNFIVRTASEDEVDVATRLEITVLRDWHVSPLELCCAHTLDPNGLFVGELNGEIISLINCIKCPGHSTFISTFLVKKEHRGKGYGKKTWDTAWKSLDQNVTFALDAVMDMVPKYETLGFRSMWNTLVLVLDLEKIANNFASVCIPPGTSILPINTVDVVKVIEYDASVFGVSRERFIQAWVNIPGSQGWVAVSKRGDLIGYVTVRSVISGTNMEVGPLSVGPLYANDDVIAKLLLKAMADSYVADKDIQETQIEMLCCDGGDYGHHGLQMVAGVEAKPPLFIGPRMYTKGVPPGRQLCKIYGTTSPAFD